MERVFECILRWLELDDEFEVLGNNVVKKEVPKELFSVLCDRVIYNITLNAGIKEVTQSKIVVERREYVDNFWGRCRLTIELGEEKAVITYVFLGYEAVVNGSVVLVDSIKTMREMMD